MLYGMIDAICFPAPLLSTFQQLPVLRLVTGGFVSNSFLGSGGFNFVAFVNIFVIKVHCGIDDIRSRQSRTRFRPQKFQSRRERTILQEFSGEHFH